jgi:Tol biopolymer transport system component
MLDRNSFCTDRKELAHRRFACRQAAALTLLALILCAALAGCASGSASPGPTPTPTPAPTPTPTPSIGNITPSSAPTGGLAFTLNVTGSNFVQSSTVDWNGNSRTTTFVNSTQLQAQIMAADLAAAGKVSVTVVNPAPGGTSSAATFTIAPATITFVSTGALDGSDAADTNSIQNIWVMNPDGSSATPFTKLTALGADSKTAAWSPDGSKIAYASRRALDGSDHPDNLNDNLWLVNADGSGTAHLTNLTDGGAETFGPVWSPDGSKIAFLSSRALDGSNSFNLPNNTQNVWIMNADGSNQKPLTKLTASNADAIYPLCWSPDGSKLVFSSSAAFNGSDAVDVNGVENIWVMNADGSGQTPLTKLTAFIAESIFPVWSPDGTKIAYVSGRALDGSDALNTNNSQNIWIMNANGSSQSALTSLTASNASIFSAAWSPNGAKIAFTSTRALDGSNAANTNGTQNIWVMNANGSSPAPLTSLTASTTAPMTSAPLWTPGGTQLLFVSARKLDGTDAANANSTQNIWLMNADGSNPTPLTHLTAAKANATFPAQP